MTILRFNVVLATIFIKININNRKTRPYSHFYNLVTFNVNTDFTKNTKILLMHLFTMSLLAISTVLLNVHQVPQHVFSLKQNEDTSI